MYQSTEATPKAPRWESAPWYADAKATCALHEVLPHASKEHNDMTTWALVAFHFNRKTNNATQAKPSLSKGQQPMSGHGVYNTATASPGHPAHWPYGAGPTWTSA